MDNRPILPSPAPSWVGGRGGGGRGVVPSSASAAAAAPRGILPSSAPAGRGLALSRQSTAEETSTSKNSSPSVSFKNSSPSVSFAEDVSSGANGVGAGGSSGGPLRRQRSQHHHHHHHHHGSDRKGVLTRAASIRGLPDEKPAPVSLDKTQQKSLDILLPWSGYVDRARIIVLARRFNRWKFIHLTGSTQPRAVVLDEQRANYLHLFAESERLREQLREERGATLVVEKAKRSVATGTILKIILRARLSTKQRYFFDIWNNSTKLLQLLSSTKLRSLELEVGLQKLNAEQEYKQETETISKKLERTLKMTVCLHEWRAKAMVASIAQERRTYDTQRRSIHLEMQRIGKIVALANEREVAVVNQALQRGRELASGVEGLRDQLQRVLKAGRPEHRGSTASIYN
ncbi:hypothetical protein B484DRAFT_450494 [Ochromonadaceae sp. CCMP2298]|nr:hypothetical protein B484DRAFT_450494 [Ochromonadaceae sp. CCMP2298]